MLERFIKKEIHHLYLNNLFRGIAFSLFGIFVPIYFLTLGYSLNHVLVYFLIFHIITFSSFVLGFFVSKKIGYKPIIVASMPFIIIFVLLLQALELSNISIYLIGIVAGLHEGLYFLPNNILFSYLSKPGKKGTQFSNYLAFGQVAGLMGPLIGAIIATFFGFRYLFLVVSIFFLISIIPLLYIKNFRPKKNLKFSNLINFSKKHKSFFVGTILDNIKGNADIIWPIFVYLIIGNLISIGWIGFLITFGTIIFTLFIGRHYDKKSKFLFLRIGSVLFAILWFTRAIYSNNIFIFLSSFLAGFLGLMITVPFSAIFFDKAYKEKDPDSFIVFSEVPIFLGRVFFWGILILVVNKFVTGFVLAGLATLLFSFLKFGIKEHKK